MKRHIVMALVCLTACNRYGSSEPAKPSAREYRYCLRYKDESVRERCMARMDKRYERHEQEVECHQTFWGGTECTSEGN